MGISPEKVDLIVKREYLRDAILKINEQLSNPDLISKDISVLYNQRDSYNQSVAILNDKIASM